MKTFSQIGFFQMIFYFQFLPNLVLRDWVFSISNFSRWVHNWVLRKKYSENWFIFRPIRIKSWYKLVLWTLRKSEGCWSELDKVLFNCMFWWIWINLSRQDYQYFSRDNSEFFIEIWNFFNISHRHEIYGYTPILLISLFGT